VFGGENSVTLGKLKDLFDKVEELEVTNDHLMQRLVSIF